VEEFKRPPSTLFLDWIDTIPNDGLIRVPRFARTYELLPTNAKVLSEVLVAKAYEFQKEPHGRKLLRLVLGDGLVVAEGDTHKFQRKNIQPIFNFRKVKALYPLMWAKAVEMTKCIKADMATESHGDQKNESIVEVNQWASRATLDIIGVSALGREFNTLNNSDDELLPLYEWIFNPSRQLFLWAVLHTFIPRSIMAWIPSEAERGIISKTSKLRQIFREFVRNKRENMKTELEESVDILAHLIRSDNFSDDELVDQVLTFLAAGHETTSSSFTWVLYLLAREPKYQDIIRNELRHAMKSEPIDNSNIASILEALPYVSTLVCEYSTCSSLEVSLLVIPSVQSHSERGSYPVSISFGQKGIAGRKFETVLEYNACPLKVSSC
jgi:cytochrome P450